MNTYTTLCEAPRCNASVVQRAESFEAAIRRVRSLGWLANYRDTHGYLSLCPEHRKPLAIAAELMTHSAEANFADRVLNKLAELPPLLAASVAVEIHLALACSRATNVPQRPSEVFRQALAARASGGESSIKLDGQP